jgi:hypothetical protein
MRGWGLGALPLGPVGLIGPFFPFSEPFLLVPAYTVVFLGMSDADAAAPWLAEGEEHKGVLGDLLQR